MVHGCHYSNTVRFCGCYAGLGWAVSLEIVVFMENHSVNIFLSFFLSLSLSLSPAWVTVVLYFIRFAGIAGDGKQQYNIYFSTWCCFLCGILTLESKMTEHNWPSIRDFIQSWPHRYCLFLCSIKDYNIYCMPYFLLLTSAYLRIFLFFK